MNGGSDMRDYGWGGRLGLGTPQGNPTVEAEMRRLIPPEIEYFTVRLTSASDDPATRLRDYLQGLPVFMARFATLNLDGFMFACTASSYLLPPEQAEDYRELAEQRLGAPVFLAADAIAAALKQHDARRIALLTPYPDWLHERAVEYWKKQEFEIIASAQVDIGSKNTYAIYEQHSAKAVALLEQFKGLQVDAYLVSGSGMPSLPIVRELMLREQTVVAANPALATAGLDLFRQTIVPPERWWFGPGGA